MKKLCWLIVALASTGVLGCDPAPGPPVEDTGVVEDTAGPRGSLRSAHRAVVVPIITAISQTDVLAFSHEPGFAWELVKVEVYARTEAGVVTAMVKRDTVTSLTAAAAFATATRTTATIRNGAPRTGGPTSKLNVHYTSDGTGVLTNGFVIVQYKPLGS